MPAGNREERTRFWELSDQQLSFLGYKDAHDPHTCATHKAAFICMSVQGRLIGCQSQSGDNSAYCETRFRRCAQKSTRHGRIPGFRSHCIRLCPCLKPDCACAVQRKAATLTPFSAEQSVLYSPVSLGRIAKYGHVSRMSGQVKARILCTSDCVAEGEGFEPPVPFQVQRFSRPPVSTTHTSLREGGRQLRAVSG
jgi:hypothetical protein